MTDQISFPPRRDLPPGHLEAREQHLLAEIAREPERSRFTLPTMLRVGRWRSWKGALVVAVAVAALAGAGVAIAAGLGAFNGISAAEHTKTGADVLPPALLTQIKQRNAQLAKFHKQDPVFRPAYLLPDTARVLGTGPDGSKVYGLTDTRGDLCLIGAMGGGCGSPLSRSHPITMQSANPGPIPPGGTLTIGGVAINGVTSVSFTIWGKPVTVPVDHNVYVYVRKHSTATRAHCIVAHFADGSTVNAFPDVSCP